MRKREKMDEKALDKEELIMLRYLVQRYLTDHMKDYHWWTNPLNYQTWMDDAIDEYNSNLMLHDKLTKMLKDLEDE